MEELKKKREEENKLEKFVYQCGFTQNWVILSFGRYVTSFNTKEEANKFEVRA